MTVQECYGALGEDFNDVLSRLMKPELVKRFLLKFEKGTEFDELEKALAEKRYEDAFRYAHNMKGVGLNLGLSKFQKASDVLCESLRNGEPTVDIEPLIEDVRHNYRQVVEAIGKVD